MFEELLLRVDGPSSSEVPRADLADLALREREHLQEWVLSHPEILGKGTRILTSELADWATFEGHRVLDRLDILGLDPDGRLVVAELKRGEAPHAVTMQALSYAAMVSRLTIDDVAEFYAKAQARNSSVELDNEGARAVLETQFSITQDVLRNPRVVLIASDFAPSVTTTAVWLAERGVDISLVRFRPYRLADGQVVVSFARILPVPDVEEFVIGRRSRPTEGGPTVADVPWDCSALEKLQPIANPVTLAMLDLCSQAGDAPVTVADIQAHTDLGIGQVRGQLAGFTMLIRNPRHGFAQDSWPVSVEWQAGGVANYYLPSHLAECWRRLRGLTERGSQELPESVASGAAESETTE